jgi:hypothetical protein
MDAQYDPKEVAHPDGSIRRRAEVSVTPVGLLRAEL